MKRKNSRKSVRARVEEAMAERRIGEELMGDQTPHEIELEVHARKPVPQAPQDEEQVFVRQRFFTEAMAHISDSKGRRV